MLVIISGHLKAISHCLACQRRGAALHGSDPWRLWIGHCATRAKPSDDRLVVLLAKMLLTTTPPAEGVAKRGPIGESSFARGVSGVAKNLGSGECSSMIHTHRFWFSHLQGWHVNNK
jgi:hypothetical protein